MRPCETPPSHMLATKTPWSPDEDLASGSSVQNGPPYILIVEDNDADVLLIEEAIRLSKVAARIRVLRDGEKAIQYLHAGDHANSTAPVLVILDLNLPRQDGFEVLTQIRKGGAWGKIPVLIVTSSDTAKDRNRASALGADGYFRKPSAYGAYLKLGDMVRSMISGNRNPS